VSSAAWVVVLNTSLWLFCGWQPVGGLLWTLLGDSRLNQASLFAACCWLNLLLWFVAEWRRSVAVPDWVRRMLVSFAFLFATFAGVLAVNQDMPVTPETPIGHGALLAVVLAIAAVASYALRRREDVYPLAAILLTVIIIVLAGILRRASMGDEAQVLLSALWLIGASTLGGRWLMTVLRRWRGGLT
jgi:hypothetical protein